MRDTHRDESIAERVEGAAAVVVGVEEARGGNVSDEHDEAGGCFVSD